MPAVGNVIREDIGDTRFNFGDGSPTIGSGTTGGLYYLVTAIDPGNDWLSGRALDTAALPAIDTTILHTYVPGTWTARIDDWELVGDQTRTRRICEDVVDSVRNGRSPLILTERNEHLEDFVEPRPAGPGGEPGPGSLRQVSAAARRARGGFRLPWRR